jgi:hypothetical protein
MEDSSSFATKHAAVHFINNFSENCGAIFMLNSSLVFTEHSEVKFTKKRLKHMEVQFIRPLKGDTTVSQ